MKLLEEKVSMPDPSIERTKRTSGAARGRLYAQRALLNLSLGIISQVRAFTSLMCVVASTADGAR